MQAANDLRALVLGVEQAEARGDHPTAERLLRQALTLQEANVGSHHPEVANILNNLAIVCELNGKLTDAEACYRRAYAIATASLPPNDPFVITSRENLEQFCKARGLPLKTPQAVAPSPAPASSSAPPLPKDTPPQRATAPPERATPAPQRADPQPRTAPPSPPKHTPAPSPQAAPPHRAASPVPSSPAAPRPSSAAPVTRRTATAVPATRKRSRGTAFVLSVVLPLLLAAGWYWFESNARDDRAALAPAETAGDSPAPTADNPATPVPTSAEPAPAPVADSEASAAPVAAPNVPPPAPVAAAPGPPPATSRASSSVAVVTAQACRSLTRGNAWTCMPATGAQSPGRIYFYTRVASPRDTTIEHRWYRGDRLEQRVSLRIRANPAGYRTYSQLAISPDRAGSWKVELRTQDGQVLGEDKFEIRQ